MSLYISLDMNEAISDAEIQSNDMLYLKNTLHLIKVKSRIIPEFGLTTSSFFNNPQMNLMILCPPKITISSKPFTNYS